MLRFRLMLFAVVCSFFATCAAKEITIHGFVTAVDSPTSFQIDEYKITDQAADPKKTLKPGSLQIGLEIIVEGEYDATTGELKAKEIKRAREDAEIEGTGLVEQRTSLVKDQSGWSGTLMADGEEIKVTPQTEVTLKRTRSERKQLDKLGLLKDDASFAPDDIGPDTFAHYYGVRQSDHSIVARKLEFQQDRVASEEAYSWKLSAAHVRYPDPKKETGTLTIDETVFQLFPSPEAHEYLTRIGTRLVPAHQRELPDDSPSKVQFRFFLIDTDTVAAGAYPNGIVVVSAHVFDVLDNEAQLAFMLAHDMARATEKQQWVVDHYRQGARTSIALAGAAGSLFIPGPQFVAALASRSVARLTPTSWKLKPIASDWSTCWPLDTIPARRRKRGRLSRVNGPIVAATCSGQITTRTCSVAVISNQSWRSTIRGKTSRP